MANGPRNFGGWVRNKRIQKDIGLREMAKMVGVSPTYQSKIERNEYPPPAEDKVRKIAAIIDCDPDELLARAGRVSSDLSEIIRQHPRELAALLRTTRGLTAPAVAKLARQAQEAKRK
jgi:transcriptional regulator with XRE-family HTH domain